MARVGGRLGRLLPRGPLGLPMRGPAWRLPPSTRSGIDRSFSVAVAPYTRTVSRGVAIKALCWHAWRTEASQQGEYLFRNTYLGSK
jgi:hypothetical protein